MTVLKSFRIKEDLGQFLEEQSKARGISQSKLLEEAISKLMSEAQQWEEDLIIMANDKEYQAEQVALANEFYEDF